MSREIERLEILLGGIRRMINLPSALFVVDVRREATAIHEANLLNIPVVALVDTNCDPRNIDYVIPSNDDAIRAIKLLVGRIADAALEGKALRKDIAAEEAARPAQMMMPGYEEPELTDEELLGAATLAKISSRSVPLEYLEVVEEEENEEEKFNKFGKFDDDEFEDEDEAEIEYDEDELEEVESDEFEESEEEDSEGNDED